MVAERKTLEAIEAHYLPLIAAARAEAEERRDEAWLDVPWIVSGLPVRALTLTDYLALTASGNAHVTELAPPVDADAELRFWTHHNFALLWLLSPDYKPVAAARDAFVAKHVGRLPLGDVVGDIAVFLRAMFADRPRPVRRDGDESQVPPSIAASFAAFWIHDFVVAYGWTERTTLAMPLPRIFQLRQLLRFDATVKNGGKPLPAADQADELAARAFAEIAALD